METGGYEFVGIPLDQLLSLRDTYMLCLAEIAVAGSSSTIGSRSFTHANLTEVRNTIFSLNKAIKLAQGLSTRKSIAAFNRNHRY